MRPAKSALLITLQDNKRIDEQLYVKCEELINGLVMVDVDLDWLVDQSEKFCKDKALYNAVMHSIQIIDGQDTHTVDALPHILSDALSVGFDNHIGHDYVGDAESRYDFYHRVEEKIPFDLEYFNKITEGGLVNKTLNVALAGTGVGKSLFMCHMLLVLNKAKMFCMLRWKCQRNVSLKELMPTCSMCQSKT